MKYAVKKGDFIENIIVAHESQVEELEEALGAELIDPSEYGLTIGDYWNGVAWTRNVDGEQVVLTPIETTLTLEERVDVLERENAENREYIAAIEDALCEIDMG